MQLNWFKHFLILSLTLLLSCNVFDKTDDSPKGLVLEVSTTGLSSLLQQSEMISVKLSIANLDGDLIFNDYPVTLLGDGEAYHSAPLDLFPGNYKLRKFAIQEILKADDVNSSGRLSYAFAHPTSEPGNFGFEYIERGGYSLHIDLLPVIFTDGKQDADTDLDFDFDVEPVELFYVFINRCNPDNRLNYHEVLAYDALVYMLDEQGNPASLISEGDNLGVNDKPGLFAVPVPPDYAFGLVIELKPIGEDVVYMIPVLPEEIDRCRRNEIDFVHLSIGCN